MDGPAFRFRLIDAAYIVGSIVTFLADQTTDIILAVSFWYSDQPTYSLLTLLLVLVPNSIVQIFSARWNKIDEAFSWPVAILHGLLLGTLHRYCTVLQLGFVARTSEDVTDYQRYYQSWSDICMLRLFDSFMESAPQLLFQLYVMCTSEAEKWSAWTGISAVASLVSLGWGVAAYSQALRMVREDKNELSWTGLVLQTTWRFFMLVARLCAMLLLCLAIGKWAIIVFLIHWLVMAAWVLWQDTDFCTNAWEERLYNAVVGVIYCFCFFNLKEGRSRYRMAIFYTITFLENISFVTVYYVVKFYQENQPNLEPDWFSLMAVSAVLVGFVVGLCSMLLYYRFYHPAGPIPCCTHHHEEEKTEKVKPNEDSEGPDFVIKDATYVEDKDTSPPEKPPREVNRSNSLKHSRSVKSKRLPATPPRLISVDEMVRTNRQVASPVISPCVEEVIYSPHQSTPAAPPHTPALRPPSEESAKVSERLDSAYGTDSNRTASRNTESSVLAVGKSPTGSYVPNPLHNQSNSPNNPDHSGSSGSSVAFNNETYMSIEVSSGGHDASYMDLTSPQPNAGSPNNTYQSVHPPTTDTTRSDANTSQESSTSRVTVVNQAAKPLVATDPPDVPLKRSPVLRDVTAEKQPESPSSRLHAPLTIIIPNISNQAFTKSSTQSPDKWSEKTISLDILNPDTGPPDISGLSSHDYENLALVNVNRAPLGPMHWRTYSDMANSLHDNSTKYDRAKLNFTSSSNYSNYSNFCDIYPLSKEMKEKLYRSLTPVSTAATAALSLDRSESGESNHTYEPIETAGQAFSSDGEYRTSSSQIPVTLISHDGTTVTAKTIVNLDNLREVLHQHEQIPYEDPENRGDLYLLAPMRLLTPIGEETESDITGRSKTYQALSTQSKEYSDVDQSIMSIISEVLNARASDSMPRSISQSVQKPLTSEAVDTNSLLSTIEEIRNNSMCNLYYNGEKTTSQGNLVTEVPQVPQVPPRHTSGYESLCAENNKSKASLRLDPIVQDSTLTNESTDHNDSIKSVNSNTLVVTPTTIRAAAKRQSPLQTNRGCRKNILNLVGSTSDILNTPKRIKTDVLSVPGQDALSDSLTTENNEFKALMPHLTFSGAKFLNKVKKSPPLDDSELEQQQEMARPDPRLRLAPQSTPDTSRLSALSETPSPAQFVRNIGNQTKPKRKLSIVREKVERIQHDDDSDYKYGFMKQNPDAKYGFGFFPSENYTVVETAKLCTSSTSHIYSLSALNKGDTVFKLMPEDTYENLQRNNWGSASLQRRPSKIGGERQTLEKTSMVRDVLSRRSMSILDDKENIPGGGAFKQSRASAVKVLGARQSGRR